MRVFRFVLCVGAEPLVYLTKIIQVLVSVCAAVYSVLRASLGVSDKYDYPRAGGWCACVLLCGVCIGGRALGVF